MLCGRYARIQHLECDKHKRSGWAPGHVPGFAPKPRPFRGAQGCPEVLARSKGPRKVTLGTAAIFSPEAEPWLNDRASKGFPVLAVFEWLRPQGAVWPLAGQRRSSTATGQPSADVALAPYEPAAQEQTLTAGL